MTSPAPLLLFAVGNPARGDDGLGPALLAALRAQGLGAAGSAVALLEDFQLQVEHMLDLQGRRAVLFIDAARSADAGGDGDGQGDGVRLVPVAPAAGAARSLSHALAPAALLAAFARTLGHAPPPAWQLAVAGERFGLGEGLSDAARARLAPALAATQGWLRARGAPADAAFGLG